MPIKYVKGDVVEAFKRGEIDVLVHGVNCQGKMNSGIAKQIRAEFPELFEYYKSRCEVHEKLPEKLLGTTQHIHIKNSEIVNAFTQNNYGYDNGRYCSYDAIDDVMKHLILNIDEKKIGMPKIGAGLGGGDWKIIEAIIESAFTDREVLVYTLGEDTKSSKRNDLA